MNCNNVVMEKEVNELSNIDLTNTQQKALSTINRQLNFVKNFIDIEGEKLLQIYSTKPVFGL